MNNSQFYKWYAATHDMTPTEAESHLSRHPLKKTELMQAFTAGYALGLTSATVQQFCSHGTHHTNDCPQCNASVGITSPIPESIQ